tara:strand:+ start:461 stop:850 length:390 start_codon:yes stop_codon:yes gene_type:complete
LLTDAFNLVAAQVLGPDRAKEFELSLVPHGGADGQAAKNATTTSLSIVFRPMNTNACVGIPDNPCWPSTVECGRGGVNVPWGVAHTPLKALTTEEEAAVRSDMIKLVEIVGLKALAPPGWMLVTEASGG